MTDQDDEQYDPESTVGIPEHGVERLERMKAAGFFTSDLSRQRVPAREGGGLRAARPRDRQLDLPRRLPASAAGPGTRRSTC